jgi:hypothetical protein
MPVTDEVAQARRAKLAKTWNINPLLAEIVVVLEGLGGAAHRNVVVAAIASHRPDAPMSDGFRREIFETVAVHCESAVDAEQPALVYLPFGEGSHRWALPPGIMSFLEQSRRPVAAPARRRPAL